MRARVILFDAYGTLLDVESIAVPLGQLLPRAGHAITERWRRKQLEYTWLRTLSQRYADFAAITGDALEYAAAEAGVELSPQVRQVLLSEWSRLAIFADVPPALASLSATGVPMAVLSNGTGPMLEGAFSHAGLTHHFAALLSVDGVRQFKPAPAAYQLAVDYFGRPAAELLLVSANGWDIAGAASFGMMTYWVNRAAKPVERLGVDPDGIGGSLLDLKAWLAG